MMATEPVERATGCRRSRTPAPRPLCRGGPSTPRSTTLEFAPRARRRRGVRRRAPRRGARSRPPPDERPPVDPARARRRGGAGRPLPTGYASHRRAGPGGWRRAGAAPGRGERARRRRAGAGPVAPPCLPVERRRTPPAWRRKRRLAASLAVPVPDKALDRRLEAALDDDGQLLDGASPALAAARREVQSARARLIKKLETILRAAEGAGDAGVTVRGGRYVIPVRRDDRQRPAGIVHDESASHGTLFLEPTAAIELGNALREAESAEERERLRVLRDLTGMLRPSWAELRDGAEMCVRLDDLAARARYAAVAEGFRPEMLPAPSALSVVNGRHPLLLAAGEDGRALRPRARRHRAHPASSAGPTPAARRCS